MLFSDVYKETRLLKTQSLYYKSFKINLTSHDIIKIIIYPKEISNWKYNSPVFPSMNRWRIKKIDSILVQKEIGGYKNKGKIVKRNRRICIRILQRLPLFCYISESLREFLMYIYIFHFLYILVFLLFFIKYSLRFSCKKIWYILIRSIMLCKSYGFTHNVIYIINNLFNIIYRAVQVFSTLLLLSSS